MLSIRKSSIQVMTKLGRTGLIPLGLCCALLFLSCGGDTPAEDSTASDPGSLVEIPATVDATTDSSVLDSGAIDEGTENPEDTSGPSEEDIVSTSDGTTKDEGAVGEDISESQTFSSTCVTTPDCNVPCASGLCVEGKCNFTPKPGLCLVEISESEVQCVSGGVVSPNNPCLLCNPEHNGLGWSASLLTTGFEPTDTTSLDFVDATASGVSWHVSTRRSYSGSHSLYAGIEESASYGVGSHVQAHATTNAITLPDGMPWLGFVTWMETEETLGYDHLMVQVLDSDTLDVLATPLDSDVIHSTTQERWLPMSVDLTEFAGQNVRIRFTFDTTDAKINGFEGVYIDEVNIWTGCCSTDIDCEFSNPCKIGTCEVFGEACAVEEIEACCLLDSGCDDGNACTTDTCPEFGGQCLNSSVEGCCLSDLDCDDSDDCTEDSCTGEGGECVFTQLCCDTDADCVNSNPCMVGSCSDQACSFTDVCCHSGADCNDNDPCTYDICGGDGSCSHSFKALAGCCSPEPYNENLEEAEHGYTFDNLDGSVGWHWVTGQQALSGSGALYYGNPATMNYNSGSYSVNTGTAISPTFFLTPGVDATFSSKVWMHTESSSYYDKLSIHVQYQGEDEAWSEVLLWTKPYGFAQQNWNTVSTPLSAFAGFNIRLKFTFDTIDGTVNNTEGAYVDDIKVLSTCSGVECSSGSDCDDGISATVEICDNGTCIYVLNGVGQAAQCSTNLDCSDDDFCTTDTCNNGFCEYTELPFCFF
jgi:hypothetical protein